MRTHNIQPARTVPTREEVETAIGGVLFNASNHPDPVTVLGKDVGPLRDKVTDAVLELLAGKPTVNEVKAEAWDERARAGLDKGLDIAELVHLGGGKLNIPDVPPPPTNPYRAQDGK